MIKEYREILGYMFARTTARTIYYHLTKKLRYKSQVNRLYRKEKKPGHRTYEWLELSNSTAIVHGVLPRYRPSKLYNKYTN